MDPSICLPLGNAGVNAISSADAVKELLSCRAEREKNIETEGHEVDAATSTCLLVLVLLHLLNNGLSRNSIPLTPSCRGDPNKVYTLVPVTTPTIKEDVRGRVSPKPRTDSGPSSHDKC